MRKEDKIPF